MFRPRPVTEEPFAPVDATDTIVEDAPAEAQEDFSQLTFTPRFAKRKRRSWHTAAWIGVCIVLILGLGAQLAWAKRDTLIADPTIGPLLSTGCTMIGCHLPWCPTLHAYACWHAMWNSILPLRMASSSRPACETMHRSHSLILS